MTGSILRSCFFRRFWSLSKKDEQQPSVNNNGQRAWKRNKFYFKLERFSGSLLQFYHLAYSGKDVFFSFLDFEVSINSSVQFSCSVVSNSFRPHELQHVRPPCISPSPGVHSNSRLSSQWCHPAISSSVVPFSSCPQSLPASESFPVSQLFTWGGQSTGVSALASFLPKKSQGWSPSGWTGWISLHS